MKQAAGIDISRDGFHACLREQADDGRVKIKRSRSFSNDYEGFKGILDWSLKGLPNGQEVCVVLANRIKHHAGSLNVKTGTDKADAALIADFGLERSMPTWQPMSLNYRELRDLCRELSSVKKNLTRARCQIHVMEHSHHRNARVTALKTGQIGFYTRATEEIESEIRTLAEEDRELKEKADRITKGKGLGLIAAVTVLCETNGFRFFDNIRQAASYAGLDAVLKESGKFKGRTGISKKGKERSNNIY
ncbi:Transposase [Bacteroidales bacterium Barb6XT]|nr:Transposase [Bacteroidales bacterium Barb6XT]